jgi:hypothetical protein
MRPADCALVVTVPLERAEFMADIYSGTDFLDQFRARQRTRLLEVLWTIYEANVATAATIIARARGRGVTVCERSGLGDFARCLEQYAVVTLVAHWRPAPQDRAGAADRIGGPGVEFVDGVAGVERIVAAIPAGFSGVLDLSVCNSTLLAEEVRRHRHFGLVIANACPATLDTRMDLYDAAMRLVQHEGVSYQDAVFMVRSSSGGGHEGQGSLGVVCQRHPEG